MLGFESHGINSEARKCPPSRRRNTISARCFLCRRDTGHLSASEFIPWRELFNQMTSMAETKPTNNKNRTRRRLLLSLLAVAVIAALAVATAPKPAAPEFRRYVGPALPDGSRVTFLYPASVNQVLVSPTALPMRPWIIQNVQMTRSLGLREAILWRLPFWQRAHPTDDLIIGVLVTKVGPLPAGSRLVSGRFTRKRVQQTLPGQGDIYVEDVSVTNAKMKVQYNLNYQYLASSAPSAAFVKHEAIITNSFQVLPPGAAVPMP